MQLQACRDSDQFGSANAASVMVNISRSLTGVKPDILDKMDNYMDNMANAVTNK